MTMEQVTAIDSSERTLQGRYLTFYMDEELYGMDIQHIIEIIGVQPITVVPEMPEYIRGITNLRGKIIPVMDARLRFRLEERDYDDRTCIIVLETGDVSMGMIVDAVSEVLELYSDDVDPPPEIGGGVADYIQGVGRSGDGVIMLLDCDLLLREGGDG